jgi:hypothetical protein
MEQFQWSDLPNAITALATLIAAFGALVIALRNGTKANEARAAAELAKEIAAAKGAEAVAAAEAARLAAEQSKVEIIATKDGVFEIGKRVDGRLSELLTTAKALARAQGLAEGRAGDGDKAQKDSPSEPSRGSHDTE